MKPDVVSRPEPFSFGELAQLFDTSTKDVCRTHILVAAIARLVQRVDDLEARLNAKVRG